MSDQLIPIERYLDDPVVVAVADAIVLTEWVSTPPLYSSLEQRMTFIAGRYDRKETEAQTWPIIREAVRHIEIAKALKEHLK